MTKSKIEIPESVSRKFDRFINIESEDSMDEFCLCELKSVATGILKMNDGKPILEAVCLKLEKMLKSGNANFYDYCLLAETVKKKLGDEKWARKLLKKAESIVDESIGAPLDSYGFEEEDSYYALIAGQILDILDDQKWAAKVISQVLCDSYKEKYTAPADCAFLVACRMPDFADLIWKKVLKGCGAFPAQSIIIANAILEIDNNLYVNADAETKRDFKKDENWHQQNLTWAKKFVESFLDELEDGCLSEDEFDADDVAEILKVIKDKELSKRFKEAMKEKEE